MTQDVNSGLNLPVVSVLYCCVQLLNHGGGIKEVHYAD